MVAESGAVLLDDDARRALVDMLLPRATVITPNLPEARVLAGAAARPRTWPRSPACCTRSARTWSSSPAAIASEVTDVLFDGDGVHLIAGERHPDGAAHGSGCTHSSALAAHLALGRSPLEAARAARAIAAEAVRDGLREHRPRAWPRRRPGADIRRPPARL